MLTYAEEYIKKKTNYLVGVLLIKCFKKKLFTTAQLRIVFHYHGTGDPIRNSGIFLFLKDYRVRCHPLTSSCLPNLRGEPFRIYFLIWGGLRQGGLRSTSSLFLFLISYFLLTLIFFFAKDAKWGVRPRNIFQFKQKKMKKPKNISSFIQANVIIVNMIIVFPVTGLR